VIDFLLKGAQPTETILNMLKEQNIWSDYIKTKKAVKKNKRKLTKKRYAAKKAKKETKKILLAKKVTESKKTEVPKSEEAK
jgi:ribosomal protein S16